MKKIIAMTLVIIMVIYSLVPPKSYSESAFNNEFIKGEDIEINPEDHDKAAEDGKTKAGNDEKSFAMPEKTKTFIIKLIIMLVNIVPTTVKVLMSIVVMETGATSFEEAKENVSKTFTIYRTVFNEIELFDINFFANNDDRTENRKQVDQNVSEWFYICRNIALGAMLVLLFYTAIRMIISSISEEKAKYKEMLNNWILGMIILMALPYLMIITIKVGDILIDLCKAIMTAVTNSSVVKIEDIENYILEESIKDDGEGYRILVPTIIYWVICFYQIKFFYMYGKRLFSVMFLIIISPLVLIQYVWDKTGDNKGNSFKIWCQEFGINVLIQPLHAFLYTIFMTMAANIVIRFPIIAIAFLMALTRGERVLRNIFRVKDAASIKAMKDNAKIKDIAG